MQQRSDEPADQGQPPDQVGSQPSDDVGGPPPSARAELPPAGCAPSLEELYQYMDGALPEHRKAHVQSHLTSCGGCGELYHVQAQFLRLIEVRCKTDPPADLPDRIFGAIPGLPPKRQR